MSVNIKKKLKNNYNKSYLARDFDSIKLKMLENINIFFPDKIRDFSEASVGGMFLDLIATVGDTMSFYMDHQFKEMDPFQAVESSNIEMHLRNAGVKPYGANPAVVELELSIRTPVDVIEGIPLPRASSLPKVLERTVFKASTGINFHLLEDLDFAEIGSDGDYKANYQVDSTSSTGVPTIMKVTRTALAVSGEETTEVFNIPDRHVPFRELLLSNENVSDILFVLDADNDEYYEVESLSQDTVFSAIKNFSTDSNLVTKNLEVLPAPKRFVRINSAINRTTKLRFGSGDASSLDDDIVPDPSELTLPLYGKRSISRFSLDPNSLLQTQTLGMSPKNTSISVRYRYGGGLNHNVDANTINQISTLLLEFKPNVSPEDAVYVRRNMFVTNPAAAQGGQDAPDLQTLKALIPTAKNNQSRIVSRQDLLARIYTLPSEFGRVFRASVADNPINPLSIVIYLVSLDADGRLVPSPDSLKLNLSNYLNEFRLISDAYDVLDAKVINFGITYEVYLDRKVNRQQTILNVNNRIADAFDRKYFQIDQPIVVDDVVNVIINTPGVISLADLRIFPKTGTERNRDYSETQFSFESSTKKGIIRAPMGSIFELRYPSFDVIGAAV
jgi:hypothetical protein